MIEHDLLNPQMCKPFRTSRKIFFYNLLKVSVLHSTDVLNSANASIYFQNVPISTTFQPVNQQMVPTDSTGSHVVTTFYPNKLITQRTGSGSTLTVEDQPISFNPNGSLLVGDDAATLNHRTAFGVHEGTLIEIGNHLGPIKKDAQTQSTATLDSRISEQNLLVRPFIRLCFSKKTFGTVAVHK